MTATTISEIVWPRPALAGCIFCMIVRDTRGVTLDLSAAVQFFSRLAPVLCVLAARRRLASDRPARPDDAALDGAATAAFSSRARSLARSSAGTPARPSRSPSAFYPDAFAAMTGLDLSAFTGRMVPAEDVLPRRSSSRAGTSSDAVRRDGIARFLRAGSTDRGVWSTVRPDGARPVTWLKDWTSSLVASAALSGPGRSARQIARRVKSWTGVSERDLHGLGHTEQLYANIHEACRRAKSTGPSWPRLRDLPTRRT